jgi:hypothetical protein
MSKGGEYGELGSWTVEVCRSRIEVRPGLVGTTSSLPSVVTRQSYVPPADRWRGGTTSVGIIWRSTSRGNHTNESER